MKILVISRDTSAAVRIILLLQEIPGNIVIIRPDIESGLKLAESWKPDMIIFKIPEAQAEPNPHGSTDNESFLDAGHTRTGTS